ncbi:glycosyltransferase family 4 protein [Deinococcus misasensis]|uniref:glycosyltransferase family 4 protein n=1 Tax=Deinococcus misasensis TaxID=392413 RepID=UPI00055611C1|nr:glycosyltransferase family 1 protein [Deinococcus misasensis]
MRVGIDGRALQGKLTGVGQYAKNLLVRLPAHLPDAEFFIYTSRTLEHFQEEGFQIREEPQALLRKLPAVGWLKTAAAAQVKRDRLDVFWGPVSFLPALTVPSLVTVHDLNYRLVPETMTRTHQLAHDLWFVKDVQRATRVVTNSQGTLNRLQQVTGRVADGVIQPSASQLQVHAGDLQRVREKHGLQTPYLLAVATWEPRKNLELLIQTFLHMKDQGLLPEHQLVLVGGRGWKDERLAQRVEQGRQHLRPLGYVPDEDLPALYALSDVFVFPSRYEGFGMPVLEARHCGTRVVTTDIPELREAGGEHAVYIEPTVLGLQNGILQALQMPRPAPVSQVVRWETGAQQLAMLLTQCAGQKG